MGYATTRTGERVAAAVGLLAAAAPQFQAACDLPKGGVLLALPALLAVGLLRHTTALYALPNGFYGIASIFLLLALMALARIKSMEQLRYVAPGEWGKLLGLDRIPEVRTLRQKLEILCQQAGRAIRWNSELAKEWIAGQGESELIFYTDGHVRVYSGDLTPLPRHYVARERLCLRGTTDYWINAMDGQPFFFINKEVDPGLLATLRHDLVPWLETNAPVSAELQLRLQADPLQHRFTLVFDREGYSPEFFSDMKQRHIAILSYHKFPTEDWPAEEFSSCSVPLAGGEVVTMKLAERGSRLANGLWVREVRKLSDSGHQTSLLSTNYRADYTALAVSMFARWSQEDFDKYMRQQYNLDRLAEYGTEPVPDPIKTVNPAWRQLDAQIRAKTESHNYIYRWLCSQTPYGQETQARSQGTSPSSRGHLNPHPEQVTDELFLTNQFFDARDLVQINYEMVRRVQSDGQPISRAAAAFGFSRPSFYQAQATFQQGGLPSSKEGYHR
jgi:hypothetical protein